MAEVAVSVVVQKLTELLIEQAVEAISQAPRLLDGVRDKVDKLKKELAWMQCFLQDADAKQEGNEMLSLWVSEIRDVAFEAEELIERHVYKAATQSNRVSRSTYLNEVGREIEKILIKIEDISGRREKYGVLINNKDEGHGPSNSNDRLRNWRQPSVYSEEEYVIELEDDMELLLTQLLQMEQRHHVVSIVGMGGLGKTTLAKKLYNHSKLANHFDIKAWVYVSKEYRSRKDILQGILMDTDVLSKDEKVRVEQLSEEELVKKLHHELDGKSYLVVLDDIWTMEVWDGLESAFHRGKTGSKVLLTTRNMEVALHADGGSKPHELRTLTKDESLKLLCNKAFRGTNSIPGELEDLVRDIVVKCGGLPLALVVIGGLLSRKAKSTVEWNRVVQNISWNLQAEDRVSRILALSYNDLPPHLKSCFLYLGLFPVAMDIQTKKLTRLWVAEGFLPQEGEEIAEGVAQKCLNELIGRCMVQVRKVSSLGRVKTVRIHDLLRDLSVSKGKQEYFLKIYLGNKASSSTSQLTKSRRHAIHSCFDRYDFMKYDADHSRSLLLFNREYNANIERKITVYNQQYNMNFLPEKKLNFIYKKFKLLRVLELDGVRLVSLPNSIGDLVQLRYLGLRKTNLEGSLPSSIGNLQNLQTLDLRYCCFLKRIPDVIWKMVNLRHLLLYTPLDPPDSGHLTMDTLTNLQSLPYIEAGGWIDRGLSKMRNLRQLGIYGLSRTMVGSVLSVAKELPYLHSLNLLLQSEEEEFPILMQLSQCSHLRKLSLNGKINKLPEPHEFPPNLIKLTLHNSQLQRESMAKLERLPKLKMLVLGKGAYNWQELIFSSEGFPQLQILRLIHLKELEEWTVEEGAIPRLELIVINGCEKLKMIPEGLKTVTTLKNLKIIGMPVEFEHRLRREDLHQFRNSLSIESTTDMLAIDFNRRNNVGR